MAWGDKDGNQGGPWGGSPWGGGNSGGGNNNGGGNRPTPPSGPDLDALIQKMNDQLQRMFGSQNGGGESKRFMVVIAAAIGFFWLSSGIYFVNSDEVGVVSRLGAFHHTTQPGLNYHLPYPIETAQKPKVTVVNRIEVGYRSGSSARDEKNNTPFPQESLMLTGDENIIDLRFQVQWKIRDDKVADYIFNVRNQEDTIRAVAESAMREVVGNTPIAPILSEGKLRVEESSKARMQQILDDYHAGVEIVSVNLQKADPPAEVMASYLDVQSARLDMETERNKAEAYRNDILPRARGEAERLVQEAEAYKQEAIAKARGESSRFKAVYAEYAQAKDVTKKRMYLETMEEILQGMNKIVVDQGGNGVVPYLPLPELKAKTSPEVKP